MVLCFCMRSCGILQLVSYRLKKYIYILSKISAWKGGFLFYFFRLLWVWFLLLCTSPLSFCAPFYTLCGWETKTGQCEAMYSLSCIDVCVRYGVLLYRTTVLFIFIDSLFNDADSNVRLHSGEWCDNLWIGNDVEGSGRSLTWGIFLQRRRMSTKGL